jgi:protocatechuate 3,4-dioxygenase, alpha subunit
MTPAERLIPSGSQTVGPFFHIGLGYLFEGDPVLAAETPRRIELRGSVLDRDGAPVADAMLEFWAADAFGVYAGTNPSPEGNPVGFHRVATNLEGRFCMPAVKPGPVALGDGRKQAPHMLVLVFARGLLRHLITRVYFDNEAVNDADPVLLEIPKERRSTLVARRISTDPSVFEWNVILQGEQETVFFSW